MSLIGSNYLHCLYSVGLTNKTYSLKKLDIYIYICAMAKKTTTTEDISF